MMPRNYRAEAFKRWQRCEEIARCAQIVGLDATPQLVNKKLHVWEEWIQKRLVTGYLIKITGVQRTKK
jgi:hypothetical protein